MLKFFCIIESSIWVPRDLGSIATLTPVPNIPVEDTPTHAFRVKPIKIINIILIFILNINTIFITGKVDDPEEKLKLTKLAWETRGVRSVKNDLKIKENFNFQQSAKDLLITSQLRTALIFNDTIKATNYQIDTYKKKIYIYGIATTTDEKDAVIKEANEILDVENVIASILLVDNLRIKKN